MHASQTRPLPRKAKRLEIKPLSLLELSLDPEEAIAPLSAAGMHMALLRNSGTPFPYGNSFGCVKSSPPLRKSSGASHMRRVWQNQNGPGMSPL